LPSINLIKASDGTGNASTATVQTVRNSGVTTIIVDTVNNIPATFMGSMGTPHTFVDPVTSEEITVISEATAVDFTGHVSGANLEIDSIAPGYVDNGSAVGDIIVIRPTTAWANNLADTLAASHDNDGTLKAGAVTNAKLSTSAGEIGGAGVSFTSSVTSASGSFSNATCVNCYYIKIGKLITAFFQVNIISAGTASGEVIVQLPIAPRLAGGRGYIGFGREDGVTGNALEFVAKSGNSVLIYTYNNGSTATVSGAVIRGSVTYEAA
jgi:hypothetical protein